MTTGQVSFSSSSFCSRLVVLYCCCSLALHFVFCYDFVVMIHCRLGVLGYYGLYSHARIYGLGFFILEIMGLFSSS